MDRRCPGTRAEAPELLATDLKAQGLATRTTATPKGGSCTVDAGLTRTATGLRPTTRAVVGLLEALYRRTSSAPLAARPSLPASARIDATMAPAPSTRNG